MSLHSIGPEVRDTLLTACSLFFAAVVLSALELTFPAPPKDHLIKFAHSCLSALLITALGCWAGGVVAHSHVPNRARPLFTTPISRVTGWAWRDVTLSFVNEVEEGEFEGGGTMGGGTRGLNA